MRYRVTDDSVTVRGKGSPRYSGKSVTKRGENAVKLREEAGRREAGESEEGSDRPARTSRARDSTSVNPLDPIDPRMPNLR
jgi:hypothetical protein